MLQKQIVGHSLRVNEYDYNGKEAKSANSENIHVPAHSVRVKKTFPILFNTIPL